MKNSKRNQSIISLLIFVSIIVSLNVISGNFYRRFDLTKEKRYSISDATKEMLGKLDENVYIQVYLEGEFESGFKRLQNSTKDLLSEFMIYSDRKVEVEYINPLEEENPAMRQAIFKELSERGLQPTRLTVKGSDAETEKIVFPGAIVMYGDKEVPVMLLENQIGYDPELALNNSVISLEYKIANAIRKVKQYTSPKIAFSEGHGELSDLEISDLGLKLQGLLYDVERYDINSSYKIPDDLDLLIIAKPTQPFSQENKYKIDQYLMKGGKVLWMIDNVNAEMDSLRGKEFYMADARDLGLTDMLFRYGVRVNSDLVMDLLLQNPIPVVTGMSGNAPQTQMFPWYYYPLLSSGNKHAIVKNLDPVAAFFANSLDTVQKKEHIKKTVLLHTSKYSKAQLTPTRLFVSSVQQEPTPDAFPDAFLPVAVMLEGEFESVFKNYLSESFKAIGDSVEDLKFVEKSVPTKMIVVGDGDIGKNDIARDGTYLPLGYYRFTQQTFANKEFLLNAIEYLLDDEGLIETRTKEIKLRMLDRVKVRDQKLKWQLINIIVPIAIVVIFGLIYNRVRKMKNT